MQEDMRRILSDESFSDMVFLCGEDAEEVRALRMLVAARSPVLESMLLRASMAESKLTRIPLPLVEAPTMRICIEFFYTDTVQKGSYLNAVSYMKVISAARYFLVDKLERLAIEHMQQTLLECHTFDVLDVSKAYTYGVALQQERPSTYLHGMLMDVIHLNHTGWDFECHKVLSEQDMAYLLQHMYRAGTELHWDPRPFIVIVEYVRLHHVIMWCSTQIVLHSDDPLKEESVAIATLTRFFPRYITDVSKYLSTMTDFDDKLVDASTLRFLKLLADQLSIWLKKFPINLSEIPLVILYKIIEPLDIIPCSMLMAAYRCQAAQALTRANLRWEESGYNKKYAVADNDATVISCKSTGFQGFARCSLPLDVFRFVTFYWEVVILTPCEQLRIGFCEKKPNEDPENYDMYLLGEYEESWALGSDGFVYSNMGEEVKKSAYCNAFDVQRGLRVGIHLNPLNCSFSINGQNAGIAWEWDLWSPEEMFPAISMQKPGEAQIESIFEDWATNSQKVLLAT